MLRGNGEMKSGYPEARAVEVMRNPEALRYQRAKSRVASRMPQETTGPG